MARSFLVPLGLLAASSDPTGLSAGEMYYNTSDNTIYTFDGMAWTSVSSGSLDGGSVDSVFGGVNPIDGGIA